MASKALVTLFGALAGGSLIALSCLLVFTVPADATRFLTVVRALRFLVALGVGVAVSGVAISSRTRLAASKARLRGAELC